METKAYNGNGNVLLIITGANGNIQGYENKYEIIAENINKKYGSTVFIVALGSNIWANEENIFNQIMIILETYMKSINIEIIQIYGMGISAGGSLLIHNSHRFKHITKILAINFIYNINYNLFCNFIGTYSNSATLILGEQDETFKYANIIKKNLPSNIKLITLHAVNHFFASQTNLFISLPEKYLY